MTRSLHKLTAKTVSVVSKAGRHSDGGGLYLSVSPTGSKKWIFLYRWRGKPTELGLGSAREVSLARAREKAGVFRQRLAEGENPKTARAPKIDATFGACADRLIEAMKPSWRNDKHAKQWEMTLNQYAAALRPLSVDKVDTAAILQVLRPLWHRTPETAERLRGRIERVMDAAKATGLRVGENPATWRGHLDQLLPRRQRLSRGHHAALPYDAIPKFYESLKQADGMAARALEFTILTAARSSETLNATWAEVDRSRAIWTLPAERMKAGQLHRVPLSTQVLTLIESLERTKIANPLFIGSGVRSLSNMAMPMLLRRLKMGVTIHGFRSSFRDWASEQTSFAHETCELALAHTIKNKTEAAYRRGDQLEKRRELMQMWADYCSSTIKDGGGERRSAA